MKNTIILLIVFLVLSLAACKNTGDDVVNITTGSNGKLSETSRTEPLPTPANTGETKATETDPEKTTESTGQASDQGNNEMSIPEITGVTAHMQSAEFWFSLFEPFDDIILTEEEIESYNSENFNKLSFLQKPLLLPDTVSGTDVSRWISELSKPSQSDRYDKNGIKYQTEDYENLKKNLKISQIPKSIETRFGITVKRTLMRTWPTYREAYQSLSNMRNDMFVETAVYPAEPVAVYHTSADGEWYFAQIYNYMAWIPAKDVAICSKTELETFLNKEEFLVVNGALIHTPGSQDKRVSELQIDMGVTLPVKAVGDNWYTVEYPVRNDRGEMEEAEIRLPASDKLKKGYPDYTTANVLKQAFKFLGEPYGWGGMNNARDCSSFILDIYRSFGIKLPRNTDQQEQVKGAITLEGKSREERLKILDGLRPGSALYMPGHTMIYLGKWQERHYIIHDAATVYEKAKDGGLKPVVLYQVAVTPLDVCTGKGVEYLMSLTTAVEFK